MIRRPPRSTRKESSAASDVYKRQDNCIKHAQFNAIHITFHMELAALVTADEDLHCGPCRQSADRLFCASQDFTYFTGCHRCTGRPQRETNMRAEMWETERRVRRLLQITFILLNPLSHSAVLTGMVLTQFIMSRIAGGIVAPRVSPYSLKARVRCIK